MRLTARDVQVCRDIALSSVLSRDQLIGLRYYTSVTRANRRTHWLCAQGYLRKLETPFFGQSLFVAGRRAAEIVGPKIASILQSRTRSPQFIQHALCTTNIRLKLIAQGGINWRFEPQLRTTFEYGGRSYTIKPDGLSLTPAGLVALECDMGHQSMARLKQKILAYEAFVYSGVCAERWECEWFNLLFVTTGRLRASRIARLQSDHSPFDLVCRAHEDLGVPFAGGWS